MNPFHPRKKHLSCCTVGKTRLQLGNFLLPRAGAGRRRKQSRSFGYFIATAIPLPSPLSPAPSPLSSLLSPLSSSLLFSLFYPSLISFAQHTEGGRRLPTSRRLAQCSQRVRNGRTDVMCGVLGFDCGSGSNLLICRYFAMPS